MTIRVKNCGEYFVKIKGAECEFSVTASKITCQNQQLCFWLGSDIVCSLNKDYVESLSFLTSGLFNSTDFYLGVY